MINYAYDTLNKNRNMKSYKYIIIDEYQDTSYSKYKLMSKIKEITNAKLFAVGDDFQSIYRFTGCDLNIFINFKKYFKNSKILKINNTYRNSKELIYVSGHFIMKNKYQIRKKLKSNKSIDRPIIVIFTNNCKKVLYDLINKIDTNILILGRNNDDIYNVDSNFSESDKVRYMTVHKSKGLEEDNVIIINLNDCISGFPNKIKSDNILSLILEEKELYPYDEERRLFYVALTRTKNYVYLISDRSKPSYFIREIVRDYEKYIKVLFY